MGQFTKLSTLMCLLFLALLVLNCDGSRSIARLREKKQQVQIGKRSSGYFLGFLPRAMPIPPSGPSRQHNSVGVEDSGVP